MPEYRKETVNKIKGLNGLVRKLRLLPGLFQQASGRALFRVANEVMTESKETYCPVDTGNLRASGQVTLPTLEGQSVVVALGYGSTAVNYAVPVHEIDKAYHNGKQWKYLETPLKAGIPRVKPQVEAEVQELLKGLAI